MLGQGPQAVAVGRDQHGVAPAQVADDGVLPVGQQPGEHVFEALGQRHQLGAEVPVDRRVVGVELVVSSDGRGRGVVAPAPSLELLVAVRDAGGGLVEAGQVAVVALVQSPAAMHLQRAEAEGVEDDLGCLGGPPQHGGMHRGGEQACGRQQLRGPAGLGPARVVEGAVVPAGEQVLVVPLAAAVAQQDQVVGHGRQGIGAQPEKLDRNRLRFLVWLGMNFGIVCVEGYTHRRKEASSCQRPSVSTSVPRTLA